MMALAWFVTCSLALLILGQLLVTRVYVRYMRSYRVPQVASAELPRAAVILSLRGADPFLTECLERLTSQQYPHYSLHVVIDSPSDPAAEVVTRWAEGRPSFPPVVIAYRRVTSNRCSLKCSSLAQAIAELHPDVEVVAIVDADAITPPLWLYNLVVPLSDPSVGVVTGNRWYVPTAGHLGSLARYVYNASAVAPMYWLDFSWGGSMALRREVFRHPQFSSRMRFCCNEEEAIREVRITAGLRLFTSPAVMLQNHEECTIRDCYRFLVRQLFWTRLFHPAWTLLLSQALAAYVLNCVAYVAGAWAVWQQAWPASLLYAGGAALFVTGNGLTLAWVHRAVTGRIAEDQSQRPARFSVVSWAKLWGALPLTFLLYTWAVIGAALVRKVDWRGITYRVAPPKGIRMVRYQPYQVRGSGSTELSL